MCFDDFLSMRTLCDAYHKEFESLAKRKRKEDEKHAEKESNSKLPSANNSRISKMSSRDSAELLSRDDIFQIQLSLADDNFELFSFSAYFSSSFSFNFTSFC